MPEWFNGAVLKTVVGASLPWVRIPPLPPVERNDVPGSAGLFDNKLIDHISKIQPHSILDVGCGSGNYRHMKAVAAPGAMIEAIEPTERYWEEYELEKKYDILHKMTLQDFTKTDTKLYDVVVCTDVLEHLYLNEAIDMIECLSYSARYIIIIWPTDCPQECWEGNPYEKHKCNMKLSDLTRFDIIHYEKVVLGDIARYHYALIKTMYGAYI